MILRYSRYLSAALACVAVVVSLPAVTLADERPKLPYVRFPFGEEDAKTFQSDYARAVGLPINFQKLRSGSFTGAVRRTRK